MLNPTRTASLQRNVKFQLLPAMLLLATVRAAVAQLSPDDELATLKPAPGFEVSLFASEPLITNPAAIDVDTHGRVWVAEIQWYRGGAKNPPADKIKVLEDTDGDGRADKATVFAEGLFAPMSVCVAGPRVYVATSPDLWVYEDADGDLVADGPPKKLLTGFGGHNHDHGAHSLVLGPDHKWWMSHGDTGFDVTGSDGSRARSRWGAVIRGELDGGKLETIATNFRNPYEVCVSSFGEAYLSDNDNDGVRRPAVRQAGARRSPLPRHALSRALALSRSRAGIRAGHVGDRVRLALRNLLLRARRPRAEVPERALARRRRPARVPRLSPRARGIRDAGHERSFSEQ
jgi:glucose/arabinose dehydrogenase